MASKIFSIVAVTVLLVFCATCADARDPIDLSCKNHDGIMKKVRDWIYYCWGKGSDKAKYRYCDCERVKFYSEARKKCDSDKGKEQADRDIAKANTVQLSMRSCHRLPCPNVDGNCICSGKSCDD